MAGVGMKKKWKHNLPYINGQPLIIPSEKLTEALELMWSDQIEPDDIDYYLVGDWN